MSGMHERFAYDGDGNNGRNMTDAKHYSYRDPSRLTGWLRALIWLLIVVYPPRPKVARAAPAVLNRERRHIAGGLPVRAFIARVI